MSPVAFFSTKSGNTRRFVERLGFSAREIDAGDAPLVMEGPFVLVTPTYNGRVPAPVVRFLNVPQNRRHLAGVVCGGNINFGPEYGAAGRIISAKCRVPFLHAFEISGLPEDIEITRSEMEKLWTSPLSLTS